MKKFLYLSFISIFSLLPQLSNAQGLYSFDYNIIGAGQRNQDNISMDNPCTLSKTEPLIIDLYNAQVSFVELKDYLNPNSSQMCVGRYNIATDNTVYIVYQDDKPTEVLMAIYSPYQNPPQLELLDLTLEGDVFIQRMMNNPSQIGKGLGYRTNVNTSTLAIGIIAYTHAQSDHPGQDALYACDSSYKSNIDNFKSLIDTLLSLGKLNKYKIEIMK